MPMMYIWSGADVLPRQGQHSICAAYEKPITRIARPGSFTSGIIPQARLDERCFLT